MPLLPPVTTAILFSNKDMSNIDGFAFLDELSGHPHAPVLVVSSHATGGSESDAEAIKRGAKARSDKAQLSFTVLVRKAMTEATAPRTYRHRARRVEAPGEEAGSQSALPHAPQ